jgi:hypothetical protein
MAEVFAGTLIVCALAAALLVTFGPDDDDDPDDTDTLVDDHEASFPI